MLRLVQPVLARTGRRGYRMGKGPCGKFMVFRSIRRFAALLSPVPLAVALAGCVGMPGGAPGGGAGFLGDSIQVAPPAGYCIDRRASHDNGQTAVVLIGKCADGSAAVPALVSASIGPPGSSAVIRSGAKALSDYFMSPAGRAALARDGRAGSVVIRKTAVADGVLVLRVADRNLGEYWRAVMGVKGRLVTLSVTAPPGRPLDEAAGRKILDQQVAAMRRANPA